MQRSFLHSLGVTAPVFLVLAACGRSHYTLVERDASSSPDASTALTVIGPSVTLAAPSPAGAARFGGDVAAAGDVNGDGTPDVLVGEYRWTGVGAQEGRVHVYFGGPDLLSETRVWSAHPTAEDGAEFGWAVVGLGDLNEDGMDDFAVGAPGSDLGGLADRGRVFVYSGGAVPTLALEIPGPMRENANFGSALASGDFDGDGDRDLAVGARYYPYGPPYGQGRVYVYYADAGVLRTSTPTELQPNDGGSAAFGTKLAAADVDGDDRDDLLVGAYSWSGASANQGRAYAFHGGPTGLAPDEWWVSAALEQPEAFFTSSLTSLGDISGDGREDVAVGSWSFDGSEVDEGTVLVFTGGGAGLSATASQQLTSPRGGTRPAFGYSAQGGGDFDGDDRPDLVVGGFGIDDQGTILVFGGDGTGFTPTPRWRAALPGQSNAQLGISVAFVGDLDGDGGDEIVSGAFLFDGEAEDEGRIEVFSVPR
ncbi:MAG: FG-GAP repeat protein [Deltaproteobacteria bacterium]|nr:FG-GAP repeat protein [Deltaproteobacteria bacterium]